MALSALAYLGPVDVALHVEPVANDEAARHLRRQLARFESTRRIEAKQERLADPEMETAARTPISPVSSRGGRDGCSGSASTSRSARRARRRWTERSTGCEPCAPRSCSTRGP